MTRAFEVFRGWAGQALVSALIAMESVCSGDWGGSLPAFSARVFVEEGVSRLGQ